MNKKYVLMALAVLALILLLITFVRGQTLYSVVSLETFDKVYSRDLTSVSSWFKDCNVEQNYLSGSCQYIDFCYAVLPKGSLSIYDAVAKDCIEVTQNNLRPTIRVRFTPERGIRYAVVTFVMIRNYTWDYAQGKWNIVSSIPEEYRYVEEVIGPCPQGMMLKSNMCFFAKGICIDQYGTNMCTNEYELYCLAYSYGNPSQTNVKCEVGQSPTISCYEGEPVCDPIYKVWKCPKFECKINPNYACADRNKDGVCDEVVSVICPDMNNNGICDSDDQLIAIASCVDANRNGICDNIETEGCFCTLEYNPVCAGTITYPNPCFAKCAGITSYTQGECKPIEIIRQCQVNSDCPSIPRCLHLIPQCINYRCYYAGECEQCQQTSDCPPSPCVGVTVSCGTNGLCQYSGKCITEPKKRNWWDVLVELWQAFWAWVLSKLGWI